MAPMPSTKISETRYSKADGSETKTLSGQSQPLNDDTASHVEDDEVIAEYGEEEGETAEGSTRPPPTMTFRVHSSISHGGSGIRHLYRRLSWPILMVPAVALVCLVFYVDPFIQNDVLWIGSGMVIALYAFEMVQSMSHANRTTELILTVSPLGLQRCRRRVTTITASSSPESTSTDQPTKNQRIRMSYEPFIPLEFVRDCILVEHIEMLQVSTHVMIRLKYNIEGNTESNDGDSNPTDQTADQALEGIVAAFPGARLTFEQCHLLQQQISDALSSL